MQCYLLCVDEIMNNAKLDDRCWTRIGVGKRVFIPTVSTIDNLFIINKRVNKPYAHQIDEIEIPAKKSDLLPVPMIRMRKR